MAKKTRELVCHWDDETSTYVLLNVPTNSAHFTKHDLDVPAVDGGCPEVEAEDAEAVVPLDESVEHI